MSDATEGLAHGNDFLTKPTSTGGLSLGRFSSSAVLLAIMIALLVLNAAARARDRRKSPRLNPERPTCTIPASAPC